MKQTAFELGEKIALHTNEFKMFPQLWDNFPFSDYDWSKITWTEIKYMNDTGDDYSEDVKKLPRNKGGIYMYIVKSPVLPNVSDYLVYIGRAQLTESHSFRVRCKKYLYEYVHEEDRPKIRKMMNYYKKHLYLKYCPIDNNREIVDLEADLINALLPPFNDKIPKKEIREAEKAFE